MSGYALHPEAFADIDEIWEYIAERNIDAADGVIADNSQDAQMLPRSDDGDRAALCAARECACCQE